MSERVSIRQLRENLSGFVEKARQGEEVIVTNRGADVAKLVSVEPLARRPFGLLKGQIWMAPDFDETPEDLIDAMEGR